MTKQQITKKLEEIGACWAVKSEKYISPSDSGYPGEIKPTWHIHPDSTFPHQDNIRRFATLQDLQGWIEEKRGQMFTEFATIENL